MVKILNIISWLLSISIGIGIIAIDLDLTIFGIIAFFLTKVLFSKSFIEEEISKYNKKLEEEILKKLHLQNIDSRQINEQFEKTVDNENINSKAEEVILETQMLEENIDNSQEVEAKKTPLQEAKIIEKKPSKIAIFLKEFFSENLFAKIGGILLTLGIIFLMSLVYSIVGPVLKIIIGFLVGFFVFGIGIILNKKGFKIEGLILIGTGILINYVVILGGRYFIGEGMGIFSAGLTFLLLILNTAFSILTSYLFSSKNILLFSIFFAYFIPFLVGSSGSEYSFLIVVAYSVILSIGAIFVSNKNYELGNLSTSKILFYFSLLLGNLLILFSPLGNEFSFITKIIGFNIISLLVLWISYKNKFHKDLIYIFITSFIFLVLNLTYGINSLGNDFNSLGIFLSYFIGIILLLAGLSFFVLIGAGSSLVYLLFLPLLVILGLLFNSSLLGGIIIIPIFLIIYLFIFSFAISNIASNFIKYFFFVILGIFVGICNLYFPIFNLSLDLGNFLAIFISAFLFLGFSYYFSFKNGLSYLYSIGTLFFILISLPIIKITGEFYIYSIIGIIIFGIFNYILPFINNNLSKNDFVNQVIGIILGILFLALNLYRYGEEYFPGVTLGIGFLFLAIIYFIGAYIWFLKLDKSLKIDLNPQLTNIFYSFAGISISLFSIAIALVFANNYFIISLVWILESSILLFFSTRINSFKLFVGGTILFIIGIVKYFVELINFFAYIYDHEITYIINILLIIITLFLNLYFIKNSTFKGKIIIKILHFIGLILAFISIPDVISLDRTDFGYIYSIIFIGISGVIYNLFKDNFSKITHLIFLSILLLLHIFFTDSFENYYFNYLFTILSLAYLFVEYLFFKNKITKYVFLSTSIYFFIITSVFLYNLTKDAFSLTIYWGILALLGVHIGILKQNKYIRSIGLYMLIITLIKISFYDIWSSLDNPILRVVALIFVGGIMMYISTLYSKNKLSFKEDFLFENNESKNI